MPPEEHWRLFIAAELLAEIAGSIVKAQEKLKDRLPAQDTPAGDSPDAEISGGYPYSPD
jgi:hypothetical protein